jgi:transcriptional regulator GlxA family with amidase domain
VFRAGAGWLEHACALAGRPLPAEPGGVGVEPTGTDLARRVSRALRRLVGSGGDRIGEAALRETAAQLELAAFALEVVGRHEPVPASGRRPSMLRSDLHQAVSELRVAALDGLSLHALAERLGCSERQLSRLFQEEIGIAFREWATALRIERACRLLCEGRLSVTGVAAETGWSSLAHFNDAFRRRVGRTPSAYRASALELNRTGGTVR